MKRIEIKKKRNEKMDIQNGIPVTHTHIQIIQKKKVKQLNKKYRY